MLLNSAPPPARGAVRIARFARTILALSAIFTSAAHAQQDTTRRPMQGMAGMPGMTMAPKTSQPKPKVSATSATRRTTSPASTRKPSTKPKTRAKTASAKPTTANRNATPTKGGMAPDMSGMPGMPAAPSAGTGGRAATTEKPMAMPGMNHKPADSAMHAMPGMNGMPASPAKRPVAGDTNSMAGMPGMTAGAGSDTSSMQGMAGMQMIDGPLGIPMERTGSGTSWLPDDSPMHAHHVMAGPWELMLHGVAFAMYDKQGSRRGDEQFSSVNWGMLMATREAGGGRLQLRGMVSAEPWTIGGRGYPLLLQTGESFQGQSLHDRQHPHDLFMELAGLYEHAVSDGLGVSLYVAPVGEPAVGPVAFPHRPSAMNDPMAPISHHWQDATHISFGVLTAGVFTHSLRLEGSIFNGREPDENRTNFDYSGRSLDSWAGRLSWNPSSHWSLTGSYAYLKSPEGLKPDESVHRVNASIMNGRTFGAGGELATTFVYGANRHSNATALEPSYLLESNLEFGGAHSIFGRAEYVRKGAEDLVLGVGGPTGDFNIASVVAGYVYEFDRVGNVRTGIGGRASFDVIPSALEPIYGTRSPKGFAIYVRFRPQRMSAGSDMRGTMSNAPAPASGHAGHP
jgi:hypothetical protein